MEMTDLREIIKWGIHNGIMATSESSKEKVIIQAETAIKELLIGKLGKKKVTIEELKSKPCPYSKEIECCTMQDYCRNQAREEDIRVIKES